MKVIKLFLILFSILVFPFFIGNVYAEDPILISISSNLDQIVFDGKWTNSQEWKKSSYNQLNFDDGSRIHLRTAHQENFIYVHINFETDKVINKNSDSAIVCFDTKNDKTIIPETDDYCFSTTLNGKEPFTYQGNSIPAINGFFTKIKNHEDFTAVGSASDKNDRYDQYPHASYEFKIPTDVIGRTNNYGFYFSVFDADTQKHYSWPYDIKKQSITSISSPSHWGDLISPDKSLPELNFSILLYFIIPIMMMFSIVSKSNLFK
ncbi:hypothetical protein [Nitrosopumilus adriaticus]|uniref:hypothetical protein n=1 Tax=Nitrosopumilus adriaticus TaxID=1580092 RepID=UPI00352DC6FE